MAKRRGTSKVYLTKFNRLQKAQSLLVKMLNQNGDETLAREFANYCKENFAHDELQFKIRGKRLSLLTNRCQSSGTSLSIAKAS
jgi:hypothetical protein